MVLRCQDAVSVFKRNYQKTQFVRRIALYLIAQHVLRFQSRSVDKRHAVITADFTRNVFQLHDLGTLNGVSTVIGFCMFCVCVYVCVCVKTVNDADVPVM